MSIYSLVSNKEFNITLSIQLGSYNILKNTSKKQKKKLLKLNATGSLLNNKNNNQVFIPIILCVYVTVFTFIMCYRYMHLWFYALCNKNKLFLWEKSRIYFKERKER